MFINLDQGLHIMITLKPREFYKPLMLMIKIRRRYVCYVCFRPLWPIIDEISGQLSPWVAAQNANFTSTKWGFHHWKTGDLTSKTYRSNIGRVEERCAGCPITSSDFFHNFPYSNGNEWGFTLYNIYIYTIIYIVIV